MEDVRGRRAEGWQSSRSQALTKIKDKIRQSCQAKATAQRQALLQQHRLSQGESHQLEVAVHAQLLQLVHDEVAASSRSVAAALSEFSHAASTSFAAGFPLSPPPSPSPAAAAAAAVAAGASQPSSSPSPHCAPGSGQARRRPPADPRNDLDDGWPDESYEAEVHAALRELEEQLLGSLMAEELDLLEQQQAAAMQEAAMQYEDMQAHQASAPAEASVLCPVCSRAYLAQQHGVIACPHERWQLDVRQEALTLADLRARLATVYELHGGAGCPSRLQFRVEQLPGRCSWLAAACEACHLLHVVI